MHLLLDEKAKSASAPPPLTLHPSAAHQDGGGSSNNCSDLTSPLASHINVDQSGPPEIPVLHQSSMSESDPNFLRQTIASDKEGIKQPSNPGYQLPANAQLPTSSKAAGFQEDPKDSDKVASEHPWYFIGHYNDYSDF